MLTLDTLSRLSESWLVSKWQSLWVQGFPSVGDVHSTVPVPREKWFEYAGERSGRFQGLTNADGSVKTECGIHVGGAK